MISATYIEIITRIVEQHPRPRTETMQDTRHDAIQLVNLIASVEEAGWLTDVFNADWDDIVSDIKTISDEYTSWNNQAAVKEATRMIRNAYLSLEKDISA